jgi:hypothetical protein
MMEEAVRVAAPERWSSHMGMDGGRTRRLAISSLGITEEGKD